MFENVDGRTTDGRRTTDDGVIGILIAHLRAFGSGELKSSDKLFFFFFSPQLTLQRSNGQFQRNLSFFKVPEGVQHFPGGGDQLLQGGGVQLLITFRNPYNL